MMASGRFEILKLNYDLFRLKKKNFFKLNFYLDYEFKYYTYF